MSTNVSWYTPIKSKLLLGSDCLEDYLLHLSSISTEESRILDKETDSQTEPCRFFTVLLRQAETDWLSLWIPEQQENMQPVVPTQQLKDRRGVELYCTVYGKEWSHLRLIAFNVLHNCNCFSKHAEHQSDAVVPCINCTLRKWQLSLKMPWKSLVTDDSLVP